MHDLLTYKNATHLLCAAHILRELIAAVETSTGRTAKTAKQAIDAPQALKKAADTAREEGRAVMEPRAMERGPRYPEAAAKRATTLERKHDARYTRLRDRFTDYTRWVHDLRLPFDDNPAERRSSWSAWGTQQPTPRSSTSTRLQSGIRNSPTP